MSNVPINCKSHNDFRNIKMWKKVKEMYEIVKSNMFFTWSL